MPIPSFHRCLRGVLNAVEVAALILLYLLHGALLGLASCFYGWDDEPDNSNFYNKVKEILDKANGYARGPHRIRNSLIIFFLLFIWLVINHFVLNHPNMLVFGLKLWKWFLLFYMVSFGYPLTNVVTWLPVHFMCCISWVKRQRKWVYFIKGMRRSLNLVLFSSSLFLTWPSYLLTNHGTKKTDDTGKLRHPLTSSLLTLVVAGVLWGLKTMLLLIWEASVVHTRLRPNILRASRSYYYVSIFDLHPEQVNTHDHGPQDSVVVDIEHHLDKEKTKKLKIISCVGNHSNLHEIKQMSQGFINLTKRFSREDDGTSHIRSQCQKINPTRDPNYCLTKENLMETYNMDEANAAALIDLLKKDHNNQDTITYANFEESMVKAHKNCVAMGQTLSDAKELPKLLNTIMIVILLVIVFIAGLLLTDIVKREILLGVASSLLALACCFSSSCQQVLEGMVFLFIMHPLNVGDRCIIDEIQLQVKHMGIVSTTFTIIGHERNEAIHSNLNLKSKIITVMLVGDPL